MTPTGGARQPTSAADFPRTGPFSLAAPGPRFAARAIDLLAVSFPALVYLAFATSYTNARFEFGPLLWLGPALFLFGSFYEFVGVAAFGRTPGKAIFGLRVVRMIDGKRPDMPQALLRAMTPWVFIALPLGVFCVPGVLVAYGSATAGELHRGLPDHAGGTLVLSTR